MDIMGCDLHSRLYLPASLIAGIKNQCLRHPPINERKPMGMGGGGFGKAVPR